MGDTVSTALLAVGPRLQIPVAVPVAYGSNPVRTLNETRSFGGVVSAPVDFSST
jgi:hypothetical protein